ncbi:uncharacterized protein Tco025E_06491 [Trypanosoma conorhini]|uniref:Calponin-homology (CH) domain-containing protein n=1 Tax=Trypanosoma conorhini TaxID=83891 RepID=A0A3R7MW42_9TRYP|nr:uncharacterized protein Tco025E_06491 [Trypanosoma conorhini]RNF12222.1 hypothetical protein Tco025E_06491 [Trypanosoma conorhini]
MATALPELEGGEPRGLRRSCEAAVPDAGREPQLGEVKLCSEPGAPHGAVLRGTLAGLASNGSSESVPHAASPNAGVEPPKRLCSGPTRAAVDAIMAEECREWVAKVVGEAYNAEVLRAANFVDALRSGVVLHVLLQKLRDPPVPEEALHVPKRATGFYARDNVVTFLAKAAAAYQLVEAQLFTDSDLCDGKNDRAVVTCLLAIARIAYTRGSTKLAPAVVIYEQEIDARWRNVSQQQLDDLLREAEEEEVEAETAPTEQPQPAPILQEEASAAVANAADPGEGGEQTGKSEESPIELDEGATIPSAPEEAAETTVATATRITNCEPPTDTEEKTTGVAASAVQAATCEKKGGTVFYLRGGVIGKDPRKLGPAAAPKSKTTTTTTTTTVPAKPEAEPRLGKAKTDVRKVNLSEAPMYNPRRWDEIDTRLSIVLNTHFVKFPYSQIRFRRLSANPGEYVVYHRLTGHKQLLLARILQGRLMIRQSSRITSGASNWEELRPWLTRYEEESQR